MCGFVGVRDFRRGFPAAERLGAALGSIQHRGPDDSGQFMSGPVGLAHARLSIIDLTAAARQPMVDSTGRYALVFNGEIYNYRELAEQHCPGDELLNRASDTAVLLAMYVKYGRKCLRFLNGMFAFAVVDLQTNSVFLARDRFGEKPLYWLMTDGCLAFASEIKALKQLLPGREWSIDPAALVLYHSVGSVPAPWTIYRGTRAVRPAHWVEVDATGRSEEGVYWALGEDKPVVPIDRDDALDGVRKRLTRAVGSRLVSDVPVGVFLSGGLDSGSILSVASTMDVGRLDALCIDFADPALSEYPLAAKTATAFGARLHRSVVTFSEFEAQLDNFFDCADQPTTDGFNTYFVSLHARALGIKVWLSGVGGDELFGGYPSFRRLDRLAALSRILQLASPGILPGLVAGLIPHRTRWSRVLGLGTRGDAYTRAYQCLRNTVPIELVRRVLTDVLSPDATAAIELIDNVYPDVDRCNDCYQRASTMETSVYMASQLLRDVDNFSMTHSIEVRAPLLDHELCDYVFSLPQRFKQAGSRPKPLLGESLMRKLPAAVVNRPKSGFTFPIEVWLRDNLHASFQEYVLADHSNAFWNVETIRHLWQAHAAGKVHWSVLWQFYAFARWLRANHA